MAIGVNATVSSADLTGQASGTITVSKPAGTASTDVLVITWADFSAGTNISLTAPSGWTALTGSPQTTANVKMWGWWALGSVAALGFTLGNNGQDIGYVCVGFTGVDNTTPVDATGAGVTNSGSATVTATAVTVATANAWELICCTDVNDGNYSATGYTYKSNGSTLHQRVGLLYNTTPKSAGSTGTVLCTNSASATGQELQVLPFALRPAASASPVGKAVVLGQAVKRAATW